MHRHRLFAAALLALAGAATSASGATLQVGPGKPYAKPCAAIAAAQAGDAIEVDAAGQYSGDTCAWSTDALTVRGVHGRAKIDLTGAIPAQQKGIFTIAGAASATIENFELSGAAVSSGAGNNGAGIRHQGLNLTVRNCYLHDNQNGILGAPATANSGSVLIENSEFSHNGAGDGYSHNMYIGNYASFTLRFSYTHGGSAGHLVKSRAFTTNVFYNRITDEIGGAASYEVDIPNGGTAFVIGNIIEQSATTQNPTIVTFGEEGTPAGYGTQLFVVNNTFINDKGSGTFVNDSTSTPAVIENNIFYKPGTISGQAGAVITTNFDGTGGGDPKFKDLASYDVSLLSGSPCIDKGTAPGNSGGQSLAPLFEYVHPLSEVGRAVAGPAIDIGAYEYGSVKDAGVLEADASVPDASEAGAGGSSGSGSGGASPGGSASGGSAGTGSRDGSAGGSSGGIFGGEDSGTHGAPSGSSAGCGCVVTSSRAGMAPGLALSVAMLVVAGRRRRSRRRCLRARAASFTSWAKTSTRPRCTSCRSCRG